MLSIKKLKLKSQINKGDIVKRSEPKKDETLEEIFKGSKDDGVKPKKAFDPTDGRWIILQDWSQCSKKCDSGFSTLHRLCIPPKNGGKPCEGEAVTTKKCNTKPCPKIHEADAGKKSDPGQAVTLKPIVKVMPYSNRPQRYHKCVIKEADLMMTKLLDGDSSNPLSNTNVKFVQRPVRAVLNDRTISFYENADDYSSHFVAYNLKTSNFLRSARDPKCFVITENKKRTELCSFGADKNSGLFDEWAKDYNLFKFSCEIKPDLIGAEFKDKLADKMKDAKKQLLADREEEIKEKIRKKNEEGDLNIIKKTNKAVQEALNKEESLEELIEKEEQEREARETKIIQTLIKAEEKKNVNFLYNF
jgi:hypothetical protein